MVASRLTLLPWLLAAGALALAAWAWWPARHGDPIATSLVAFERHNRLTVFSAELAPVVSSDDERVFGLIKSRQIAVIPARVDYTIDLADVGRADMTWDEASQRLTVTLPQPAPSRPNLDEGRAQYLREGVWISRTAQDQLTRDNTRAAEAQAAQQAANPVLLELARDAAGAAVARNLAVPLQVAGFDKAAVTVRFSPR